MLEKYINSSGTVVELSSPDARFAKLSEKPSDDFEAIDGAWVLKKTGTSAHARLSNARSVSSLRDAMLDLVVQDISATDTAFMRLIGAYSVVGSYPDKQKAMAVAVKELGEDATADELYTAAVDNLG